MASVQMTRTDSIVDEVEQIQQRIEQRAYDLFRGRGAPWGDPWQDWFAAEHEIVRRPAVELSEKDGRYTVLVSLAGIDVRTMHVSIAPQDLVVRTESEHTHDSEDGQVHQCELRGGCVFRAVHFPRPVDMGRATAEYRDGLLTVQAPVAAEAQATRLEVKVA